MPTSINVNRLSLISTMKKNRDTHVLQYNEAKAVYLVDLQAEMTSRCSDLLAKIAADVTAGVIDNNHTYVSSKLTVPTSHAAEYDNKIAMFDMSVDDNIELSEAEFRQYVRDQWNWSGDFRASTSGYLNKGKL